MELPTSPQLVRLPDFWLKINSMEPNTRPGLIHGKRNQKRLSILIHLPPCERHFVRTPWQPVSNHPWVRRTFSGPFFLAEARGGWGNVEILKGWCEPPSPCYGARWAHHLVGKMAIQAATLFAHHDPRSAQWSLTVHPLKVTFPKGKDHLPTMMKIS